jgi:hypothetical protein
MATAEKTVSQKTSLSLDSFIRSCFDCAIDLGKQRLTSEEFAASLPAKVVDNTLGYDSKGVVADLIRPTYWSLLNGSNKILRYDSSPERGVPTRVVVVDHPEHAEIYETTVQSTVEKYRSYLTARGENHGITFS